MLRSWLLQLAPLRSCVWRPGSRHITHSQSLEARAKPQMTSVRFPHLKRGPFAELTSEDIDVFRGIMPGESRVLGPSDGLDSYNTDWIGIAKGSSQLVLRPKTTKEVSDVLKYCDCRHLAVVPQGGNTGLVAGSIPVFDEIILSTELMTDIISVDATAGILVCQAGCILATLDDHLSSLHLMMPIDLGSKGSCRIGGNVSTNAGGVRLLRYGSLHGSVLGIEAVLANGDIVDCLSTMRKDNTGYDMKQLFIGSEGTLGVVTAVSILCPVRPNSTQVAFLGCESFGMVCRILWQAKLMLSEALSAYEFLDAQSMTCITENLGLKNPLHECPFYVLVEVSGSNSHHDESKLNSFLQAIMDKSLVLDGTLGTGISKMQELWQLRERVTESLLVDGYNYKYDISLPLSHYYDVVTVMRDRLAGLVTRVVAYGHVGDGNLHLNVTTPQYDKEVVRHIEPFLYEYTSECAGSISAEHGLGLMKNTHLHYSKSPSTIQLMHSMKALMDPKGILNPYKTLPPE